MPTPSQKVLEALYVVNKEAKQHSTRAESYRSAQQHNRADQHKDIKDELYRLKTVVLEQISDSSSKIEKHIINQHKYYCFYFEDESGNEWSFHLPTGDARGSYAVEDTKELHKFTPTQEPVKSDMELPTALDTLQTQYGAYYNGPEMYL